ncbi:hypothetical protein E2C01_100073 [Portunus trituberculatus]|uniref:Uncharacterized protein n=1 Tax=Portunus trituberculatus TaxID=210409 RepID=A0A5B7KGG9_PORTR|nr:hypothetical protein [Portunus trituberculatus]
MKIRRKKKNRNRSRAARGRVRRTRRRRRRAAASCRQDLFITAGRRAAVLRQPNICFASALSRPHLLMQLLYNNFATFPPPPPPPPPPVISIPRFLLYCPSHQSASSPFVSRPPIIASEA